MRFDEDIEIDPSFREERERVAAEAERDRRIRQEVVRVLSGEAEEDLAEDERLRLEQKEREAEEREAEERRRNSWWNKWFQALFTGEILTNEETRHIYPYLMFVAGMFFLSIFILFSALRLDIKRSRLQDELRVLQEQSVRQSEQLYKATSRSAIIEQSKLWRRREISNDRYDFARCGSMLPSLWWWQRSLRVWSISSISVHRRPSMPRRSRIESSRPRPSKRVVAIF